MILTIGLVVAGLIALVAGGELLVRGAVGLAEKAGISALVIGLVIVGFGTSMPELVTSIEASLAGSPEIAWGNIVGSNIANSLLILGAAALVAPIALPTANRWRDPGVCLAASVLLLVLALSGPGGGPIGGALVACLVGYVAWCYLAERRGPTVAETAAGTAAGIAPQSGGGWFKPVALTLVGLAVLILGGRMLVAGAIDLARLAGLGETLIGLTIVAVGTSLPELVTSVIAARKGEAEVAFGNVVGSNIYNILGIGGATMLLAPGAVPAQFFPVDLPLLLASALALLAFAALRVVGRLPAIGLVAAYVVYLSYLVASA